MLLNMDPDSLTGERKHPDHEIVVASSSVEEKDNEREETSVWISVSSDHSKGGWDGEKIYTNKHLLRSYWTPTSCARYMKGIRGE